MMNIINKITKLIIHCSASNWGDRDVIDGWHKKRGWKGVGYHYVILNGKRTATGERVKDDDGLIEPGRIIDNNNHLDYEERGAHAYGFNSESIGVCLIGNKSFTPLQFQSLIYLCRYYQLLIPGIKIMGHYELNDNKNCPNFDVKKFNLLLSQITDMGDIRYYFETILNIKF